MQPKVEQPHFLSDLQLVAFDFKQQPSSAESSILSLNSENKSIAGSFKAQLLLIYSSSLLLIPLCIPN
jgi:hypothetical protein